VVAVGVTPDSIQIVNQGEDLDQVIQAIVLRIFITMQAQRHKDCNKHNFRKNKI